MRALLAVFAGGLVGTGATALLNPPLPERVKKMEVTQHARYTCTFCGKVRPFKCPVSCAC